MPNSKLEVRICLGSSCYSRGNEKILDVMQSYLHQHNLNQRVDFRGKLCSCNCNKGPNIRFGDKDYHGVSESNIELILEDVFQGETKQE